MNRTGRIQQAEELLSAFNWDVAHCRQVRDLSVSLFDQLGLDRADRDLLEAAALLHDVGWTIGHDKHHKHTYRLIRDSLRNLSAFTASEVDLIANVARYHRKALPSLKHEPFAALSESDRQLVRQLAGLLRVADGLDRPHRQAVQGVHCHVAEGVVRIAIQVWLDPEAHCAGGERKRDLFEEVFECRLEVVVETFAPLPA